MTGFDIDKLVSQLSLQEKGLLLCGKDFWHTADIERLGIPSIRVSDGPNGVRGTRFFNGVPSGCFPCGTALGATFDKDLLFGAGKLMATEAKAKGAAVILGPTVNMQRSPLGGRGFESFSEDPVVSGLSAAAIINGMQEDGISATLKHYVCNDIEQERQSINSVVTERALRELYLLPFQLAMRDSSPNAIMTAYNKVNGEHASQSKKLLTDILREEWGWDGTIMSDWFGVYSLRESIEGGLDLEMPGPPKIRHLDSITHEVNSKELHRKFVDDRVKGVLKLVKYAIEKSGLPLDNLPENDSNNTPETAATLRKIAQDSIVLLKNEGNLLPLKKDEKVAVFGCNAKAAAYCGGGSASLASYYTTTPYEGITAKLGSEPPYSVGASAFKNLPSLGEHLVKPDGTAGYIAKVYDGPVEDKDRKVLETMELTTSNIFLFDVSFEGIKNGTFYIDVEGTLIPDESGTYDFGATVCGTALIYINDKLVVDNKTKQVAGDDFFGMGTREEIGGIELVKGEKYKVRIEYGSAKTTTIAVSDLVLGGALKFGYQRQFDANEEISHACELAKSVDKAIICIGLTQEFESEGFDRPDMELPGATNKLIEEVLKVQPNTIVVNQSGTPVRMPWYKDVPALVQAWFGGNEGGNAIADVLFGDANPSGKLSLTFPLRVQDNPAFLNFKSNNGQVLYGEDVYIGYKYYETIEHDVMFPFGFGLSYTTFEVSDLKIAKGEDTFKVSVTVKNTGDVDGAEVVQVYVSQKKPSITRPLKELKDFGKVSLKAGESKTIDIDVNLKYATSFYHEYEDAWCSEAGDYEILVGTSSADVPLSGTLTVDETTFWKGL